MNWSEFRQHLFLAFNEDELETLCFDLNIDYEALSGDNKNAKIRELIAFMRRQNRMPEFVAALKKVRPHVKWDGILQAPAHHFFPSVANSRGWLTVAAMLVVAAVAVTLFLVLNNRAEPEIAANEIMAGGETPTSESSTNTPTNTPSPSSTTPPPAATATERPSPSQTPTATILPTPMVAPVAADEYMVLVAQLEPLTANERDVTRFIVDDLTQILEVGIPFSRLRIREYPEIITSSSQALAVAEETGAAVIIWGKYDEEVAEVELQVGSLAAFPGLLFDRKDLVQIANIRSELANARQESLAPWVNNAISLLELAADISPAQSAAVLIEIGLILDRTGKLAAPLIGDSVSVRTHQIADALYKGDSAMAVSYLNEALDLGGGNPLLYYWRGSFWVRSGEFQNAIIDLETAIRLGPDEWKNPYEVLGFIALFQNDPQEALTHFENGVQGRPDQWRSFFNRGLAYFLAGEYDQARADLDQAIDLEPEVNWPYAFAIQVALRQGKLVEAINLGNSVLEKFPDPAYGNRVLEAAAFGNDRIVIGPIISSVINGLLQQWPQVLLDVEEVIAVNDQIADVYWMQGFAHCNLDNYETAEASYTTAVELDPTFVLPYLSRAAVRLQQGDTEGAEADFQAIADSELSAAFASIIPFVRSGQLNCHNFLTFGQ